MAFDRRLADRVLDVVTYDDGLGELRMFGGWGITIDGNMAVGVIEDDLIVRVGADYYPSALKRAGARPFDFTGRSMTGWVYVDASTLTRRATLASWVDRGITYAKSLPPKTSTGRSTAQASES